jgi:hypothetical protein
MEEKTDHLQLSGKSSKKIIINTPERREWSETKDGGDCKAVLEKTKIIMMMMMMIKMKTGPPSQKM